jgi:hypothetical protein
MQTEKKKEGRGIKKVLCPGNAKRKSKGNLCAIHIKIGGIKIGSY